MPRSKAKPSQNLMDRLLAEASWLLSHAQALTDYGRPEEAAAEQARAAAVEEQVACLLDADAQVSEAAIHRVSAASCYEKLQQHARAVTLLRAALSAALNSEFRARVERQLARCLVQAQKEVRRAAKDALRKQSPAVTYRDT
jgi:hypothetical protein